MIPDERAPAPWCSTVRLGAPCPRGVPAVIVTDEIPPQACGGEALFCATADIILLWRDGAYRVAVERMWHPPPSSFLLSREAEDTKRQSKSKEDTQIEAHAAIQRAVGLIFSGNERFAWRYLRDSCPREDGCRDAIVELSRTLDRDPYYRAMYPIPMKANTLRLSK